MNDTVEGASAVLVPASGSLDRLFDAVKKAAPPVIQISWSKASDLRSKRIELPRPIIEGLLRRRDVMIMAGESKVGKTWLGLDMACCVASGHPWLGMDIIGVNGVLYLNYEIDESVCNLRVQKICEKREAYPENLHFAHLRGQGASVPMLIPALKEKATACDVRLIIIDALYNALGDRDENSNGDMAALMAEFTKLTVETDCAVVIIHHFNKSAHGGGDGRAGATKMSGAGALHRAPEGVITFSRIGDDEAETLELPPDHVNLRVETSLRTFREVQPFVVTKAPDDCLFVRSDADLAAVKRKSKRGRPPVATLDDLVEYLGNRSMSPGALKDAFKMHVGCGGTRVDELFREGLSGGRLRKDEAGCYTAAKLKPSATAELTPPPSFPTPIPIVVIPFTENGVATQP